MSSPLAPAEEVSDMPIDEEMTNAVDQPASPLPNGTQDHSSSTMDHDYNPHPEGQTSQSAPHHNRKDATLREFLGKMDEYAPIIPDAVTSHYLTLSGLPPPNPSDPNSTPLPLARLLALATQKFIADVAADAYQYSRIRASNTSLPASAANIPPVAVGGAKKEAQLGVQRSGFGGGGQGGSAQGRTVLTMEDLGCAVAEYGVNVRRGEFYR